MNQIDILQKIIENNGNCTEAKVTPAMCDACPLSKLKTHEDGTHMGCLEALGAVDKDELEADKIYLEAAKRKLLDIQIDDLLKEDDELDTKRDEHTSRDN